MSLERTRDYIKAYVLFRYMIKEWKDNPVRCFRDLANIPDSLFDADAFTNLVIMYLIEPLTSVSILERRVCFDGYRLREQAIAVFSEVENKEAFEAAFKRQFDC